MPKRVKGGFRVWGFRFRGFRVGLGLRVEVSEVKAREGGPEFCTVAVRNLVLYIVYVRDSQN